MPRVILQVWFPYLPTWRFTMSVAYETAWKRFTRRRDGSSIATLTW